MLLIRSLQLTMRRERDVRLDHKLEDLRNSLPEKTKRAVDLHSRERCFKLDDCHPGKGNGLKSQQERI